MSTRVSRQPAGMAAIGLVAGVASILLSLDHEERLLSIAPARADPAQDTAPQGGKLVAGPSLRAGMAKIRKLVIDNHSLVTHRRLSPSAAQRVAADMRAEVEQMRSSSDKTESSRAALDELLARLVTGADAVAGQDAKLDALDGIVLIDEALSDYAQRFDDPDWRPIR